MFTYKNEILVGTAVALVVIGGVFGWQYFSASRTEPVVQEVQEVVEESYRVPPPGESYTNDQYRFSLTLPQGFEVRELDTVIVIENSLGDGIQVVVTPIEGDFSNLTAERVQADIPGLVMRDIEVVEVGEGHTGLAFLSDNQAFDGASREVWFAFGGHLYQLSTYERLDLLAQAIFSTWEFF